MQNRIRPLLVGNQHPSQTERRGASSVSTRSTGIVRSITNQIEAEIGRRPALAATAGLALGVAFGWLLKRS